jgi:putative glutamine amidotransferase
MSRPIIGVTTSLADGEQRLDLRYVRAVERAGGLPVPVPILEDAAAAEAFAALLDGLVVIGGPGITRGLVGALPPELAETPPLRAEADARLLGAFLDAGRPALGICYGMQLASAVRGGTIWGDVERQLPGALVHSDKRGAPAHPVRVHHGTHLRRILGTDHLDVPTHHLHAVREPGAGLDVSATAPDGVVEAVETADGQFVGVQFHPERMNGAADALFRDLVERARAAAVRRRPEV